MISPHEGLQCGSLPRRINPDGENASIVLFATRLVGVQGQCGVRLTVLFKPAVSN